VKCAGCGLLIAQPQATPAEMDAYYRRTYYEVMWPDDEGVWRENRTAHQRTAWPILRGLCGEALQRPARVLEIGCGYGAMLDVLRTEGHRPVGIELSLKAAAFCRTKSLAVVAARIPDLPFRPGGFDLVLARHVIEHLADPREFVARMVQLARPGGYVAVETENARIAQYMWDRLRCHLSLRVPPFRSSTDHTYVFRPAHVRRLLEDAGCESVDSVSFSERPRETLHWRLYKGLFRTLDRIAGGGELVMAAGRVRTHA